MLLLLLATGLLSGVLRAQEPPALPPLPELPELALPDALSEELSEGRLRTWEDNLTVTSLGPGDIPAVDAPRYISVENASLILDATEVVFVADFGNGDIRIYPQSTLVWHQVVNDTANDEPVSITYCPLTGSVVGYKGTVGRFKTRFGVSGPLVNNNTVLYDRATNTQWLQLLGVAFSGPLRGQRLERFPLLWTTWRFALPAYPGARVMTRETGRPRRFYGKDPYGNYHVTGSYYHDAMIVYPLTFWDRRLHPKEPVYGLRGEDGQSHAVRFNEVKRLGAVNFTLSMLPANALFDPRLDTLRVFRGSIRGRPVTIERVAGELRDRESNSVWTPEGLCSTGAWYGERLDPLPAYRAFWFALAAFNPTTRIVPPLPGEEDSW